MRLTPLAAVPTMLDGSQVVLDDHKWFVLNIKNIIWLDSLAYPTYIACASLLTLVLHAVVTSAASKKLYYRLRPSKAPLDQVDDVGAEDDAPTTTVLAEFKQHVHNHGGPVIFTLKLVRLIANLGLLGLSIATLILEEKSESHALGKWGKKRKHKQRKGQAVFTDSEWLQFALCNTFAYTSILGLASVAAKGRWSRIANFHAVLVLLSTFGVYLYRDLYPLATFTLTPMDINEGWILWTKVGLLGLAAVIIPLVIPTEYIPFDPKDPQEVTNPEQTASLLSFWIYAFLDPIIFLAYKVPHLSHAQLPPLADYDYARNLVKRSFRYLDTFSGAKKVHIFWGLLRVFSRDYALLFLLVIVKVTSGFASPIGINRLLYYLEHDGEGAVIRPWVWVLFLFFGPVIGSIAIQWYIFTTTGLLVRVEVIITQLVFEHALRIRIKSEVASESSGHSAEATAVGTPDTASVTEGEHSPVSSEDSGDTSGDETAREPSTASGSHTRSGKAKAKGGEDDGKKPESQPAAASAKADNLVGKINNLVTSDLNNLVNGRDFLFLIVSGPLEIALCIWFLYAILGWSAFVGLAGMITLFPLPGYIAKLLQTVQTEKMKRTDARVQAVTETMNVLRMIKLFGWERKMSQQLYEKREYELKMVWKGKYLGLANGILNYIIPMAHMIITYFTFTLIMKRQLSASIVFSSMAVFDMLREQLFTVFFMVPQLIEAKVSLDRVNEFLHTTELLDAFSETADVLQAIIAPPDANEDSIGFKDAIFSWSNEDTGAMTPSRRHFKLKIDDLLFKRGCINLVVGPTGSGKTSLLMALLGEMHFIPTGPGSWFHLPRTRGVAYAAQESWVQNETIKENIVFGGHFDEERYQKVIYQCALTRDLELFDAGDATEVGEKGLTLSGGQKARITLARAVYSAADIILLDDVLAALDVHTSKWIVDKCFKGDLIRGRTVILVTHNVALASPVADFVVSLGSDGRVVSQGSISDALAKDSVLFAEVAEETTAIEKSEDEIDPVEPAADPKKVDGKLIKAEEIAEGHVSWYAIKTYLVAMGGNWPALFWSLIIACFVICELSNTIQTWFLGYWATQYDNHDPSEVSAPYYLTIYASLLVFAMGLYCIAWGYFWYGSMRAAIIVHQRLIDSIVGTTLRWLDKTPTSRVIARCTSDMGSVDGPFAQYLGGLIEISLSMLLKFGAVILFTPVFAIPGVVIAALGGWLGQIYMKAQLSVKREKSNTRAPVLGHFGAAIAGLTSIRAYGAQTAFKQESLARIDRYTQTARMFFNLNRWITIRIDALGSLFAAGLAAFLVYGQPLGSASNTGFSLTMAVGFSSLILIWVRILNQFEVDGNSLERILQYVAIEQEPKPTDSGVPPAYWPASGDLRVEDMTARYSLDGPEVLHGLSFHIKAGERVGIVGRTGSGKSSLTLSLLRCIPTEGKVFYDGLPIDSVNLDALRSNITIIPQVPELLSGSLRQNLDPFNQHDDATLNDALRHAGLFSLQSADEEGRITLDSQISSGGGNLSVGQRQILALARAIVRQSKLLILDEATSAIDYKTDTIIQSSLRNELKGDVTIITVAHRLQTIMDADKIMVLDAGRIMEFGSPTELLKNENGLLRALVDESNDKTALYDMAAGASKA